jgi:uncharacterized peroxidase-related enzyme
MSIIKTVKPEEATGKVAAIYQIFKDMIGFVPNAFLLRSESPELLEVQAKALGYYWNHETLSKKLQAFIRLTTSVAYKCEYCVNMNTGMLMQAGVTPDEIEATKADPSKAPLDKKELSMLNFVVKVIRDSNSTTVDDMENLRNLGWTDKDILDATWNATSQVASDMIFNAFKIDAD